MDAPGGICVIIGFGAQCGSASLARTERPLTGAFHWSHSDSGKRQGTPVDPAGQKPRLWPPAPFPVTALQESESTAHTPIEAFLALVKNYQSQPLKFFIPPRVFFSMPPMEY